MIPGIVIFTWLVVAAILMYWKGKYNWKCSASIDTELLECALLFWPIALIIALILGFFFLVTKGIMYPFTWMQKLGEKHRKTV